MITIGPEEADRLAQAFDWFASFPEAPIGIASLNNPCARAVHFAHGRHAANISELPDGACLLHDGSAAPRGSVATAVVAHPRVEFARMTRALASYRTDQVVYDIREGAMIAQDAVLEKTCRVEPGAVIGPDVRLGREVEIMAGAVIRRNVSLGDGCRVHPLARLGCDGYGYGFDDQARGTQMAHLGGVVLGENVDIGPGSTICAGTLDATILDDGAKIDGHVYIGHNVHIGRNVQITAGAVVGGSCRVGDGALIHPGAMIKTKIEIGAGATVGIGAAVVKPVAAGDIVMADIASEIRSRLKREAELDGLLRGPRL